MIKLYDENSYLSEFKATVTGCEPCRDGFRITLDQTAFFPTAGGQDSDTGTIDGEPVINVEIENDIIYHTVKKPLAIGAAVKGKIDWKVRFRKMQHHSAEHIVSGLAHTLLGAENVGFHLSDKEVTIDYDRVLSAEEILMLERAANEAVQKNIEITAVYPTDEELEKINYRSKLELTENIRIVTIDGVDVCACCAPHVKSTGEIGVIKLKDVMHHRGGVRMRMICGNDALFDYENKYENALRISNLLSSKQEEIADSVERIISEFAEQKQKNAQLIKQLMVLKAEKIPDSDQSVCIFEDDIDADGMRILANEGKAKCKTIAVLCGNDKAGYSYVIASKKENLREKARDINSALGGRGGGREDMIQGFFGSTREEIERYFMN